jgi:hypothetical protein
VIYLEGAATQPPDKEIDMKHLIAAVSFAIVSGAAFANAIDPFLTDPVMPAKSEDGSSGGRTAPGVELPGLKYWDPA